MNTEQTITPGKGCYKKKIGEIYRFQEFMRLKNLQPSDISKETGISARTIKNAIYDNTPLGGKLLRVLHSSYGVSIDWLLSGEGQMFCGKQDQVANMQGQYLTESERTTRMVNAIRDWSTYADEDHQAWLETELNFRLLLANEFDKRKK